MGGSRVLCKNHEEQDCSLGGGVLSYRYRVMSYLVGKERVDYSGGLYPGSVPDPSCEILGVKSSYQRSAIMEQAGIEAVPPYPTSVLSKSCG